VTPALTTGTEIIVEAQVDGEWLNTSPYTLSDGQTYLQDVLISEGADASDYRLISFPTSASVWDGEAWVTPLTHLEAFLGVDHHPSNWILGTWDPLSGQYIEGIELDAMMPGQAYWLISAWNMSFEVAGKEPPQDEVQIMLQPGWNMIASPYSHSGGWEHLSILEEAITWDLDALLTAEDPPLWPSLWAWENGRYQQVETIGSGSGVWVLNRRDTSLGLLISRDPAVAGTLSKSRQAPRFALESVSPPSPPTSTLSSASISSSGSGGGGGCLLR
jgi:hypothetical protein